MSEQMTEHSTAAEGERDQAIAAVDLGIKFHDDQLSHLLHAQMKATNGYGPSFLMGLISSLLGQASAIIGPGHAVEAASFALESVKELLEEERSQKCH